MSWKKTLVWVFVFTLVIGLFEVAFLYDFKGNTGELTENIPKHPVWFLLLLHALILVPCFVLGYGRVNPIFGFFPPVLLNSIYWYISAVKMKHTLAQLDMTLFPHFYHLVIGTSFLAGFFGIIIVFVTRKVLEMMEESNMEKESENQNTMNEEDKQAEVNGNISESADVNSEVEASETNKTEISDDGIKTEKPVIEGNVALQKLDSSDDKADNINEKSD